MPRKDSQTGCWRSNPPMEIIPTDPMEIEIIQRSYNNVMEVYKKKWERITMWFASME